ncbi:unnamed protein product [Brassicogethes aeneus]|uniref:Uncharacterized protein n=1 Tax=Brassicogethes aeneus TaxID=1431903 RepID=A0A9P0B6G6_BRAAE|nr:unnamed protein product [Brassicogethes aeneus]
MRFYREMCREPGSPLVQISNRNEEREQCDITRNVRVQQLELKKKHCKGPLPNNVHTGECQQYQSLEMSEMKIGLNLRDNCIMLKNWNICCVENILSITGKIRLLLRNFLNKADFCDVGVPSFKLGIYKCSGLEKKCELVPVKEVAHKCFECLSADCLLQIM